jgi:hypothetical protein
MRGERIYLAFCCIIAFALARPYAGSWNDGSRLAMAQSIVDHQTLAITESVFVNVPIPDGKTPSPYPADREDLLKNGTYDKLLIGGEYYTDKTPLPSIYLAGVYKLYLKFGGATATQRIDLFCRLCTWASSGLAFVLIAFGLLSMGKALNLSPGLRFGFASAFSFATIVPGYVGYVNSHILQLAAATWLFVGVLQFQKAFKVRWLLFIGTMMGVAYACDASAGPTLCLTTTIGLSIMTGRLFTAIIVISAAMPWLIAHHTFNYLIGGTIAPANANLQYLLWPGSPFNASNITGRWAHESIYSFSTYLADLLVGKQGFLFNNLPAMLAAFWALPLLLTAKKNKVVLGMAMNWAIMTVLLAAFTSSNRSGQCLSVRWFLPLLASAMVYVGILLRDRKDLHIDLLIVSVWGLAIGCLSAIVGAWTARMIPGFWILVVGSLVSLSIHRYRLAQKREIERQDSIQRTELPFDILFGKKQSQV